MSLCSDYKIGTPFNELVREAHLHIVDLVINLCSEVTGNNYYISHFVGTLYLIFDIGLLGNINYLSGTVVIEEDAVGVLHISEEGKSHAVDFHSLYVVGIVFVAVGTVVNDVLCIPVVKGADKSFCTFVENVVVAHGDNIKAEIDNCISAFCWSREEGECGGIKSIVYKRFLIEDRYVGRFDKSSHRLVALGEVVASVIVLCVNVDVIVDQIISCADQMNCSRTLGRCVFGLGVILVGIVLVFAFFVVIGFGVVFIIIVFFFFFVFILIRIFLAVALAFVLAGAQVYGSFGGADLVIICDRNAAGSESNGNYSTNSADTSFDG